MQHDGKTVAELQRKSPQSGKADAANPSHCLVPQPEILVVRVKAIGGFFVVDHHQDTLELRAPHLMMRRKRRFLVDIASVGSEFSDAAGKKRLHIRETAVPVVDGLGE